MTACKHAKTVTWPIGHVMHEEAFGYTKVPPGQITQEVRVTSENFPGISKVKKAVA